MMLCNSLLLLCSLLLMTASTSKIPQATRPSPCCLPRTMTLKEQLLELANGQVSTKHITHYVDLSIVGNNRYAQRVEFIIPGAASYEWINFDKNLTKYFHSPSQKICIETFGVSFKDTCVLKHTTFNNTATLGEAASVDIFTYIHDNVVDSVSVNSNLCIPVDSLVYRNDINTITKSSYFNETENIDSNIFQLPSYCFSEPRPGFEDVKHLLPAAAKDFRFIL